MSEFDLLSLLTALAEGQSLPSGAQQFLGERLLNDQPRARAFGVTPATLEDHLQQRTALLRSAYPSFRVLVERALHIKAPLLLPLWDLWLPLAMQIAAARQQVQPRGLGLGVLGGQGTGKTTLGAVLTLLLARQNLRTVSLSIDDFYTTYHHRTELKQRDPRYERRGPPGTHTVNLGLQALEALRHSQADSLTWVPRFDKTAHRGHGDRFAWVNLQPELLLRGQISAAHLHLKEMVFKQQSLSLPESMGEPVPLSYSPAFGFPPGVFQVSLLPSGEALWELGETQTPLKLPIAQLPSGWDLVSGAVDVVVLEGWFVGARPVAPSGLEAAPPPILTPEDRDFAQTVNTALHDYLPLWQCLDRQLVLYVSDYTLSKQWRREAEQKAIATGKGGMTDAEIDAFVEYFWRALHPELFIKPLTQNPDLADLVIEIQADHSPGRVYQPGEEL
ncbi:hypothetical protein [Leptolyngbya sp. FACHB-261]|uniref:hypothetical protein n=1 Tax=Leptolyngbya sp. FACHB-261 TaxID=2692806 RepID=UPI0016825424|nr:hypothetical protein [Leptolyngbya sp. FACHB-261]MBD2099334.1 hypothetical protein [Leptolyngbya sp. FACHB-261]